MHMKHRALHSLAVLFVVLCSTGWAQVRPVPNTGFEAALNGLPREWTILTAPETKNIPRWDTTASHSGRASLLIDNTVPGASTAVSGPVELAVGHLYRLSGWIRTSGVQADPTSRYPTALAATLTMASFPFTMSTPAVAGTRDWARVEVLFFATRTTDRVNLHLGFNGTATGKAWFDDVLLEEVNDIGAYIPLQTVKWFGPAFRYTDKGWINVHIEGKPYERGYQYGTLLAPEISSYMEKLAFRQNGDNPRAGWNELRTLTDALMLRLYDQEYLEEMQGIADGAAAAGSKIQGRTVNLLDIVTVNSAVDISQLGSALTETAHPLSGRSFRKDEEEARAAERLHKCSSFLANGNASRDGQIVFGQLFMWAGYTGVHWDVICDVQPAKGHRLVYQTFPGGIHSGSDFYINDAGIMIGETTVMQTPFNAKGEPQSSRIRKAAQYASSIDDVVRILTTNNNGLYTNDWLIGDIQANETAILLLGTETWKLWRSSKKDFPGGTDGFYWSVNNAKDPGVRGEYIPDPSNAPFDVVYGNSNRDLAFVSYYAREKGRIDELGAVNALATSPINRPHACDGKVTNTTLASHMMFLAHYGKVTLREKLVDKNSRLMPDLPNAIPHLTLGYTVINPVYIAEQLKGKRPATVKDQRPVARYAAVESLYTVNKKELWLNTVLPATEGDNWFVSGTAAYWQMLNGLPSDPAAAASQLGDGFAEMGCRLQYTMDHEGSIAPVAAQRVYDRYGHYVIPRIRGTIALHQLRLFLGNAAFMKLMTTVHDRYKNKPMTTAQFLSLATSTGGAVAGDVVRQWITRDDLPAPAVSASAVCAGDTWTVTVTVKQAGVPYRFASAVAIESERAKEWRPIVVQGAGDTFTFTVKEKPLRVAFDPGNDIPVRRENNASYANLFDDFSSVQIVYGTARQLEANHTLALRYQTMIADQFVEYLLPLRQDADMSREIMAEHDLVVLGGAADNALADTLARAAGITLGRNSFTWQGKAYTDPDDGLFVAFPNPFARNRTVYLFAGNSALQLQQMTKRHQPLPTWAVFKAESVATRGFLDPVSSTVAVQ
jgi:hypothetical protein